MQKLSKSVNETLLNVIKDGPVMPHVTNIAIGINNDMHRFAAGKAPTITSWKESMELWIGAIKVRHTSCFLFSFQLFEGRTQNSNTKCSCVHMEFGIATIFACFFVVFFFMAFN